MLYDRPYMQAPSDRKGPSALAWLLIVMATLYLGSRIVEVFHPGSNLVILLNQWFAVSRDQFLSGKLWTPITYSLLHGGFFHIAINMLIIFGIGRSIQAQHGERKFLMLFFLGVVIGGAFVIFLEPNPIALTVGASGGALALITVYCFERWEMPVTLLFFEITFKLKWLFYAILAWQLAGYLLPLLGQAAGGPGPGPGVGVSHTAHLGGILGGFLFYRYLMNREWSRREKGPARKSFWAGWLPERKRYPHSGPPPPRPAAGNRSRVDRKSLQKEVDRILDKINSQGFGSLSEEEKKTLDRAKDILSR